MSLSIIPIGDMVTIHSDMGDIKLSREVGTIIKMSQGNQSIVLDQDLLDKLSREIRFL